LKRASSARGWALSSFKRLDTGRVLGSTVHWSARGDVSRRREREGSDGKRWDECPRTKAAGSRAGGDSDCGE
jgi:hypothetical protein